MGVFVMWEGDVEKFMDNQELRQAWVHCQLCVLLKGNMFYELLVLKTILKFNIK